MILKDRNVEVTEYKDKMVKEFKNFVVNFTF